MNLLKDLFKKKLLGGVCLLILLILVIMAIFADQLAPFPMVDGSFAVDLLHRLEGPYWTLDAAARAAAREAGSIHWFGTDELGRDIFSYLIYGARTSVILCVSCTLLSTIISVVIGTLSAVIGGWFDLILQRIVDGFQCIPSMLILLMMMSVMGKGMPQLIFALSVPSGIGGSRMIRSAAFSVKDSGYCRTSDLLGGGVMWKTIFHVIPNTLPLIIITAAGSLGGVVMMEASLNYLGYGVAVGTPSWGVLITDQGRAHLLDAPWLCIAPGVAIALMVFAASMFGDAIRDLLDPRLRGGVGSYNTIKIKKLAGKQLRKMERAQQKKAKAA